MATPQPSKTMSSRLMNMKFMQRSPASAATTDSPDKPSNKRKKLDDGSAQAIDAASKASYEALVAAEDSKRQKMLDKQAEAAGDTKWVLDKPAIATPYASKPLFTVVSAGFGGIDTFDSSMQSAGVGINSAEAANVWTGGRRSFGRFNKRIERQPHPDLSESEEEEEKHGRDSDNEESSSSNDSDSDRSRSRQNHRKRASSDATDQLRAKRKEKKDAEARALREKSVKRKSSQINLNRQYDDDLSGLTSISGGGSTPKGKSKKDITCFNCNGQGHMGRDCPNKSRKRSHGR